MTHFLRRSIVALTLIVMNLCVLVAADVTGTVKDKLGEPMIEATIKLLAAKDSSFVKGGTTNLDGKFTLKGVRNGSYIIQASYIGYDNSYAGVKVGGQNVAVPAIVMNESSIMLKETVVTGVKTEITVKEDTIEYNAGSYKTQPNAVMEDLLKKLPGVEVDADGKITAGGKEVKKILVDGKEFFADDPKVASKNLPVEMINKLQVIDRKSDLARLTGVDDGEEETVINLSVKPEMKNGYWGVVSGGYGTDDRYAADFNINRMWRSNQITLLGNFNNVNQLGFTDSNGSRFMRFGGGSGLTTSQSLGLNFNVGREDEKLRVGGNVFYSHTDQYSRRQQERQYLFADSTSYLDSWSRSEDKGHNVRGDFRVQWKPDSNTTVEFRPRFSLNFNDSESSDSSFTRAGDIDRSLVTKSLNTGNSNGKSYEAGGDLWINHNVKSHPGRSFSAALEYSFSNVREKSNSFSWNRFYSLMMADNPDSIIDEFTNNHTWSNRVGGRLSWTEPLGDVKNGRFLTISYRATYRFNNADKNVFDYPFQMVGTFPDNYPVRVPGMEPEWNDTLSNQFRNDFFNQRLQIGFRQVTKDVNLDVGVAVVPSMSRSKDLIRSERNIPERWVWNVAPYMRFRYKMSKSRSMNIDYRGNASEPSLTQLQPVADYSNPMRVVVGNPDLKPSFRHNLRVRFQDFNMESQRSIMAMFNVNMTQNSIVSKTTFNQETGGQISTYTNVNGNWGADAFSMVSFPFRNKNWQFNANLSGRYTQSIGFNNGQRNRSNSINFNPSVGIAFRPEDWDFDLRPYYGLQSTRNTLQRNNNRDVHSYGGRFSGTWYSAFGLIINTDLSYSNSTGYSQSYDTSEWMWNASISYQFLRDKSATISIKGYDLLQQRKNVRRSVTANYIDDTSYNSLTRYFMCTLSYRFNTFGKGKRSEGGMGGPGGFRGGMGGPGGPGGRRGGGPR